MKSKWIETQENQSLIGMEFKLAHLMFLKSKEVNSEQ